MEKLRLRVHAGLRIQNDWIAATCMHHSEQEPARESPLVEDSSSWQIADWYQISTSDWQYTMAVCYPKRDTSIIEGIVAS